MENEERRSPVLTDNDIERIVTVLLKEENIDKFAASFEKRWVDYFDRGLGRGLRSLTWKGVILLSSAIAAYGMWKGWR